MDALQCYDSSSGSDTDDANEEGDLRRKRLKPAPTASGKVLPSSSVLLPPPPLEFFSPRPNPRKAFRYVDRSWSDLIHDGLFATFGCDLEKKERKEFLDYVVVFMYAV